MSKNSVEALLFASNEPLLPREIAKILAADEKAVLRWLIELQGDYKERGIVIRQVAGGFEMKTNEACFDDIEKIVPTKYERVLSRSGMETITVIAYNQPIKRHLIAKFRDVSNPDYGIQSAIEENLIKEVEDGFVTTDKFLKYFGINDLQELPKINQSEKTKHTD